MTGVEHPEPDERAAERRRVRELLDVVLDVELSKLTPPKTSH